MLLKEIGATQGSRISSRTTHFPRKSLRSERASPFARTSTRALATKANTKVFHNARKKV